MNMKKILSIALSLVMIMAIFTGCGSNKNAKTKDNGSYFKEVKKMQEIKTGTGEVELSFDVSADSIKKDKTIPVKKDGKIQGKLKVETTTESTSKLAAKISLQYLTDTYEELTTVVIDGSKLYMNMGSISKFISKIDSESGKQFESALKQIGATGYVSLN